MTDFDPRPPLNVSAETNAAGTLSRQAYTNTTAETSLSPVALAIAAKFVPQAFSAIVLVGLVRIIEFSLIVFVGLGIVFVNGAPNDGVDALHYVNAIVGVAVLSMLAFQVADIYHVRAFRGREKQYMRLASAWSAVFLISIAVAFFANVGNQFSNARLGSFYIVGLFVLIASRRIIFLLVRKWTLEGRLTRRAAIVGGGKPGSTLISALRTQKDSGH